MSTWQKCRLFYKLFYKISMGETCERWASRRLAGPVGGCGRSHHPWQSESRSIWGRFYETSLLAGKILCSSFELISTRKRQIIFFFWVSWILKVCSSGIRAQLHTIYVNWTKFVLIHTYFKWPQVPLLLLSPIFPIIFYSSSTLLTGMTSILLYWAMASDFSVVRQLSHTEQWEKVARV
jgi:hypothetical protein